MAVGHVLTVGSSMSDATLVKAAEEGARPDPSHTWKGTASQGRTVVLTAPDPARSLLLGTAFEVVVPGGRRVRSRSLRVRPECRDPSSGLAGNDDIERPVFRPRCALPQSVERGRSSLGHALTVTGHLRSRTSAPSPSPLSQTVSAFLDDLGEQ